jgi:hypothetical protein
VLDQALREPLGAGTAHERDQRPRHARQRCDVQLFHVVRGERRHGLRDAAMGHRDQGRLRHGRDRRDTGDELERDAGVGERERLLAAPSEHERVAPLQAHDEAPPPVLDQRAVHLRL